LAEIRATRKNHEVEPFRRLLESVKGVFDDSGYTAGFKMIMDDGNLQGGGV
jgi:hypothetical protein